MKLKIEREYDSHWRNRDDECRFNIYRKPEDSDRWEMVDSGFKTKELALEFANKYVQEYEVTYLSL